MERNANRTALASAENVGLPVPHRENPPWMPASRNPEPPVSYRQTIASRSRPSDIGKEFRAKPVPPWAPAHTRRSGMPEDG